MVSSIRRPRGLDPLTEPPFRNLFFAQAISVIGDGVAPVAIAFAVLGLTSSPSALGLVLAARTAPMVAVVLAAGVLADRVRRQRVMLVCDFVRFASQGTSAVLLLMGQARLWELAALQGVLGVATGSFLPTSTGLVPQTVTPERLQQANGLLALSIGLGGIIGPMIAGGLVATAGAGWGLAVDALTFGASGLFLLRLRGLASAQTAVRTNFRRELQDGWHEVRSRTWASASILYFGVFQFLVLGFILTLGPVVSQRHLGGASAWAAIVTAFGAGSMVGGALALRIEPRRPLRVDFSLLLTFVGSLFLLGLWPSMLIVAAAWAIAGVSLGLGDTLWLTTLQRHVPTQALSRVSSFDWLGSLALRPLGLAAAGAIAAAVGLRTTLWATAAVLLLATLGILSVRSVRMLGNVPQSSGAGAAAPRDRLAEAEIGDLES